MPRFQYRVINSKGAEELSEMEAVSENDAMKSLSERSLVVVDLKMMANEGAEIDEEDSSSLLSQLTNALPMKVIMTFYEQLSFLLSSGIPLHLCVRMVMDNSKHGELVKVLGKIFFYLTEGNTLSSSLQKFPRYFPSLHSQIISVGEKTGTMDKALLHLNELVRERTEIESQAMKAAAYPMFLLGLSATVGLVMVMVIFPKFQDIFSSFGTKLPPLTQNMMNLSQTLRDHTIFTLGCAAAVIFAVIYFVKSQAMAHAREKTLLAIPIVKSIFINMFVSQFSKTLSGTLRSGIPLLDSLLICRQTIPDGLRREFLDGLIYAVREGNPMSQTMERTHFVPELVWQLTSVGEKTGDLAPMMENIFTFYKKRYLENMATLASILKPVLMFSAAIFIGTIAAALFIPMFKMGSAMKRGD